MTSPRRSTELRGLLAAGPVVAPFVFDGLQARLAERAGFSVLYLTGFGSAAARGLPDLGLLGLSDMAAAVALVALGDLPLVYNGTARRSDELAGTGVALQLHGGSLASIVGAVADVFKRLANNEPLPTSISFPALLEVLGVDDALATVEQYEEAARSAQP